MVTSSPRPATAPVGNQFLGTDLFRDGRRVGNDATACQFMAPPRRHGIRLLRFTPQLPGG